MSVGILGKSALCLIGGGGVILTGCYAGGIIKFGDSKVTNAENIPWVSLSEEVGTEGTYTGKLGKGYGRYLLAVHGDSTGENANEKKWVDYYERYKNDNSLESSYFEKDKINAAYKKKNDSSTSGEKKALNKVCEEMYNKNLNNEVSFSSGSENKEKLGRDILKYCSPLGQIPTMISQNDSAYSGEKNWWQRA